MRIRFWAGFAASLLLCGSTLAAITYGGANMTASSNAFLHLPKPSASMVHTAVAEDGTQSYIIRFKAAPVASYTGGIEGLAATNPHVLGHRILDTQNSASAAYANYLQSRHSEFLAQAEQLTGRYLQPRFSYRYAFNGMAVRLTQSEAARVASLPEVLYVQPDRSYKPTASVSIPAVAADTAPSRTWISADAVWAKSTFNTGSGSDNEGEGIVVADLDTGINAKNSSFAATGLDGYAIPNPLGTSKYLGVCNPANTTTGQPNTYQAGFPCNSKLIGAYTYTLSTGNDPHSPEDSEGHGSHTASTIAGDFTNATSVSGITSPLSGVAPHANIIAYDVCDPTDACSDSASVAAVDQAIQDQSAIRTAAGAAFKGMVMNFSIGGSNDPYTDPVDQAFFNAEQAGIYVSAAGGNSGPILNNSEGYGPVEHLAPWLTTNAASTHNGVFTANQVTLAGAGAPFATSTSGLGYTGGYASHEIGYAKNHVYSSAYYTWLQSNYTTLKYPLSGQAYPQPSGNAQADAAQCLYPFAIPSGQTFTALNKPIPAGAVVVCDRGSVALVDKADNVKQGGAGAIVIVSQSGNAEIGESYEIPGTMLSNAEGTSIESWLGTADNTGFTASLSGSALGRDTTAANADQIAAFSSRGPNNNVYDNILKPDVAAPGVSVLAAVADPCDVSGAPTPCTSQPETFDFYDGTSMATPHDTGSAAVLKELHSSWTPMEVKSALMSSAATTNPVTGKPLTDQCSIAGVCQSTLPAAASPQVRGAGRIDLATAARVGFVLDEPFNGVTTGTDATAAQLQLFNLASLADNQCITSCNWTRKITATQATSTLNYTVTTPSWMTVAVNGGAAGTSETFSLAPGGTATLAFTASMASGVTASAWNFGEVDFATSSNEDDGSAAPAQHFPVAVYDQIPEPYMAATPSALTAQFVPGSTTAQTQTLTISNQGQLALNWNLYNVATPNSVFHKLFGFSPMGGTNGGPNPTAAGTLINNLFDNTNGYFADFYKQNHGIYSADRFSMPVSGSIQTMSFPGFMFGGQTAALANASEIDWYVYPDAGGVPAGNPEDGSISDYAWHFSASPTATGVGSGGSTISLNLATAGAPVLNLQAGAYWIVVVVHFPTSDGTQANSANTQEWLWGESSSTSGVAEIIDPANLLGAGVTSWTSYGTVTLAYTLTGTLNCSGNPIQGVTLNGSANSASGSTAAGSTTPVSVVFNPSGLTTGTNYVGALCLTGNAPATPFIAIPISEELVPPPVVTSLPAANITHVGASISALVDPKGASRTSVVFNYGTSAGSLTSATGATTVSGQMGPTIVAETLSGLQPCTAYYYQAVATNNLGEKTSGTVGQFQTLGCVPTLTSVSPTSATAGGAAFTLVVSGTNFESDSVVNFNGTALKTTFSSAVQLSAAVPASAIATAGTFNVTVTNPAPGGGTSGAQSFTVQAASSNGGGSGGGGGGGLGLLGLLVLGLIGVQRRRLFR